MSLTTYDKIWNDHLVDEQPDGTSLLFVDRHLIHEVTSWSPHELNVYLQIIKMFHPAVHQLGDHSKFYRKL